MDPIVIVSMVSQLLDFANKVRAQLIRNGEWTPAQESEFQSKLETAFNSDAWKPHGPLS